MPAMLVHRLLSLVALGVACLFADNPPAHGAPKPELVDVRKIWDAAPQRLQQPDPLQGRRVLCTFREGKEHVSADGAIRVITSPDGEKWASAALLHGMASICAPEAVLTPNGR